MSFLSSDSRRECREHARSALASRPSLVLRHALIEDVLGGHEAALGDDLAGYRGHVYRTFNFAWALAGYPRDSLGIALAASFHDLGLWTARTFDYLEPSVRRALEYTSTRRLPVDTPALERVIEHHHQLTPCRHDAAVEAFRRADLVDLSWGWVSFGLPRELVSEAHLAFPNAGFHRCLWRVGWRWVLTHPLRPLPMLRW